MPWLVGTALLHSLAVTEKRGEFKSWTVLLAIIAFSLSLLGTFLVRSGILTSVHAFASDPARGKFVLMLLALTIVSSLVLYAIRAPEVRSRSSHNLLSRETMLLANNLLLVVAWVIVMLGTLYPLVIDFVGAGKISVGAPYFNLLFVPVMSVLALVMGFGIVSRWKNTEAAYFKQQLRVVAIVSVLFALAFPFLFDGQFNGKAFLGIMMASWIVGVTFKDLWQKSQNKKGLLFGFKQTGRSYKGMVLGHLGFAVTIVGITLVSQYNVERNVKLAPGDPVKVAGYLFTFKDITQRQGPNFNAYRATIDVTRGDKAVTTLHPEKRTYFAGGQTMTEAGIHPGLLRDLFVALGEPLQGDAWAVRIQYKPFVRWIWLGCIIMASGGLLAISDKRYRLKSSEKVRRAVGRSGAVKVS
jgi:cytochrome c-type biogenesis protein CcmF